MLDSGPHGAGSAHFGVKLIPEGVESTVVGHYM